MQETPIARCGIICSECSYKESMNCPGCIAKAGKPFWGECAVATCCIGKSHDHCGQCADFPCGTLNEFAFHPTEGDNGKRIENLRRVTAQE